MVGTRLVRVPWWGGSHVTHVASIIVGSLQWFQSEGSESDFSLLQLLKRCKYIPIYHLALINIPAQWNVHKRCSTQIDLEGKG